MSNFRLLDCIVKLPDLIKRGKEIGLAGLAITDHETIAQSIRVCKLQKENPDFKIAIGNEIYLTDVRQNGIKYWHQILIAKDAIGHKQLRQLSSIAWMNSYWDRGMERVPTLKSELKNIVMRDPGHLLATSACFLPGQKVKTFYGDKNIEDLTSEDIILTDIGKWEKINYPTCRDYNGKGYSINITKEFNPISCTEDHQFLILNNNKLLWKRAKDLCKNDKLVEVIPPIQYSNNNIIRVKKIQEIIRYRQNISKTHKTVFQLPDKITITPLLMRTFGLWLGDGHISEGIDRHTVGFTFNEKEFEQYFVFVEKGLSELGLSRDDYSILKRQENHRIDISINKVEIFLLFKYLFGLSHADNKYIPTRIKNISKELNMELFFGYELADGYFRYRKGQGGEIVSASISSKLTKDMEQLALSFNLSGSITIAKARTNSCNHKESYYLTFSNSFLGQNLTKEKFITHEELVSLLQKGSIKKKQFLDFIEINNITYRIKKIKEIKEININEKVYCLNTNSHNFTLNNVIVHNCLGGELSSSIVEMERARQMGDNETATIKYNQIVEYMQFMDELFGNDFYVEVAPAASKDQIIANNKLVQIAHVFNKKVVIGDDAHYLKKEDRYIHKAYLNSKGGERETDAFYEYAYLQDENDLRKNLEPSIGIMVDEMCRNSMEMFDKIEIYNLLHNQTIPSVPIKDYPKQKKEIIHYSFKEHKELNPILKNMFNSENIYERYWINECWNVLQEKELTNNSKYLDELEEEARVKRVIGEKLGTNMFKYPITLKYYIDMIWECGSLVGAGRGSSCAALNHYLLGITQLDPIEWNLPFFRYMNDERTELGDIDIDICPSKKGLIVKKIKEERGSRFNPDIDEFSRKNLGCTLVATYGTEQTKSAVLTACRGYRSEEYPDGIDNDEAQYIASLIPSERGFLWPLEDVINGNKDKEREPVYAFVNEVKMYPGLLDIIFGIVGLINKRSSHASGVILFDEDPYEFGCFMRTPKGEVITQYDLHDCEAAGMVKYDFLVTEVQDKLAQAIRFLQEDGVIEDNGINLRSVYDKYFHPNVLPMNDKKVWDAIQNGTVINVFQFDSEVGSQAAKKIKPTTILELTDANGLMRLMTAEKGAETPMEKYIRFKNNLDLWYKEMYDFGLTPDERDYLEPYFKSSYGVPPSQEQLMLMLMDKNICGFTLAEANSARKIVGKKQMSKIPELHQMILEKASSEKLGKYVWENGVGPQMGYSFSIIHALAYSFIGFQTAYIATRWNPIYWDTACLVVNSGSLEEEDENEYDEDDKPIKKKEQSTDYGKIAKALGEIIDDGIKVSLIDINKSDYGFKPDVDNNQILFGMKALSNVGAAVVDQIKQNRPYKSFKDFLNRCPLNKTAMINLIKGGAFDNLELDWANEVHTDPRILIMAYYLSITSEPKKKLTLQNFSSLINNNLVPSSLDFEKKVFFFNKYLKEHKWKEYFYIPDEYGMKFYSMYFDMEKINIENNVYLINQKNWDKIYQTHMDFVRDWLKENQNEILDELNSQLFKNEWDKYATGTISAWEMASLCFYYHEHELKYIDNQRYGIVDFNLLSSNSEVDYFFRRNGKQIPIYKLYRIAGTVIGKNDTRHIVTLLTTTGVVSVKFSRDYYAMFNRQISEIDNTGVKKIKEKGWFTRGTKLLVTGYRRDDTFVAKKYKSISGHTLYKITTVEGRNIGLTSTRYGMEDNK